MSVRDSDTIDVGIDLGTTNSAIAVMRDGVSTIVKNNDNNEITPSAVWLRRADQLYVGERAKDRVREDPINVAFEFKQQMGLAEAGHEFPTAGVRLTPPQLSAEVLKSLRVDFAHSEGAPPDYTVITVPAAFTMSQNKATVEAAVLAGFQPECPLVQEPTAAAFAFGMQDADTSGYWMVFDFGGGTFDAAVVNKREGELQVLNHAGDSYLGGKLVDWALVEQVLAPAVAQELGLRDFRRDNPEYLKTFAVLKSHAEQAKIALSRQRTTDIFAAVPVPGGGSVTIEPSITREQLERVAEPFYVRAINLAREALAEASLGPADIDRLLLVGGTTLAPGLRERLADPQHGLGIELDTSMDPTTVVARGAALFAGTLRRPRVTPERAEVGEFVAQLSYEPSVATTTPTVAGKIVGAQPGDTAEHSVVLSNPEGRPPFRSARIPLSANGSFLTEVDIDADTTSRFTIELTGPDGSRRTLTPDTFSFTHRPVEFGGVRLANSMGVQLADRSFAPLLRKGATLPAAAREIFHTTAELRRDEQDALVRIPLVQGERPRADRNRPIGVLEIHAAEIRIDLPAGSEVEVTFEVDASSTVTVFVDVPLIQEQFEADIDQSSLVAPDPDELADQLADVEARLAVLRRPGAASSVEATRRLDRIDSERAVSTVREELRGAASDPGAAAAAEERIRDLHAELDDIEKSAAFPAVAQRLRDLLDEADGLVQRDGTAADRQALTELRRRGEQAIAEQDTAAVQAQHEEAERLVVDLERRNPDWPVKLFYALQEVVPPSNAVNQLVREGRRAIADRDVQALGAVNQRLHRLLPPDQQDAVIGLKQS